MSRCDVRRRPTNPDRTDEIQSQHHTNSCQGEIPHWPALVGIQPQMTQIWHFHLWKKNTVRGVRNITAGRFLWTPLLVPLSLTLSSPYEAPPAWSWGRLILRSHLGSENVDTVTVNTLNNRVISEWRKQLFRTTFWIYVVFLWQHISATVSFI